MWVVRRVLRLRRQWHHAFVSARLWLVWRLLECACWLLQCYCSVLMTRAPNAVMTHELISIVERCVL
jgi:hypothetical protein